MKISIEQLVQDSANSLYDAGIIDVMTMREFEMLKVSPVHKLSPRKIKTLRLRNKVSQKVFARLLNVSASSVKQWEMGERQPSGPALKLLNLIARHGIEIVF